MRSSMNACRADFFIPFTALIIVSGLTSIFNAASFTFFRSNGKAQLPAPN